NRGSVFLEQGQWDTAMACFRQALALEPNAPNVAGNLASTFLAKGDFENALLVHRETLQRWPEVPLAHFNRALALLLLGHFAEGWKEYEWRLLLPEARGSVRAPRWNGGSVPGRTIVLQAEQGFGDTLQFQRYVPLVRPRANAARVILECPRSLQR